MCTTQSCWSDMDLRCVVCAPTGSPAPAKRARAAPSPTPAASPGPGGLFPEDGPGPLLEAAPELDMPHFPDPPPPDAGALYGDAGALYGDDDVEQCAAARRPHVPTSPRLPPPAPLQHKRGEVQRPFHCSPAG